MVWVDRKWFQWKTSPGIEVVAEVVFHPSLEGETTHPLAPHFLEPVKKMEDIEKEMRERAEALLLARTSEAAKARRHRIAVAKAKKKYDPEKRREAQRRYQERKKQKRVGPDFLEPPKKSWRRIHTGAGGYSLLERLVARTDPGKWYSHAQLLKLLPETNKNGLHAILYQKARGRGLVERLATIQFPEAPWLTVDTDLPSECAALRSRYVYRIGSDATALREAARRKEAALRGDG